MTRRGLPPFGPAEKTRSEWDFIAIFEECMIMVKKEKNSKQRNKKKPIRVAVQRSIEICKHALYKMQDAARTNHAQ
jgi:hypothetical protein